MKVQFVLVLVALAGLCHAGSMYSMAYTSEHTISPDFANWLFNHGYPFNDYYVPDFLSLPIPASFDFIIYQNDGGSPTFDPAYKTNIETWVTDGGTLLYYGRDSLNYADPLLMDLLGLTTDRINVNEGDFLFDFGISVDSGCYALANGHRRDLRGVVPSQLYPNWVEDHLNLMTEVVPNPVAGTFGCLPSSLNNGYHLWTIRPHGAGRIIFMSTSTYTAEEFYKPGFYAAAFLNAYYSALRGVIVGDPHVVTLAGQAFDMPIQSYNRYFNFFKSSDVNLNGYISPMLGIAPGLWVTQVGLQFTVDYTVHQFHAYIDEDLLFRFILDDRALEVSESSDHWSFSLETSHVVIGAWHDKSHLLSTGVFSLLAEGGSVVTIQAVEWRDAPSFSIKVSESLQSRDRNIATGLLQHPLDSETRDVDEMFNVFIYEREALFP